MTVYPYVKNTAQTEHIPSPDCASLRTFVYFPGGRGLGGKQNASGFTTHPHPKVFQQKMILATSVPVYPCSSFVLSQG